jgi:hypothetical protein
MDARAAAVENIQNRIIAIAERDLSAKDCLAVALASAIPKHREEIISFLLNRRDATNVGKSFDKAAITNVEWTALYGRDATTVNNNSFNALIKENVFIDTKTRLENAMRCTLAENTCKESWKRPLCVAACQLAVHTNNPEEWCTVSLGGFVRGDSRRLDDIVSETEEAESDTMVIIENVLSLASAVSH